MKPPLHPFLAALFLVVAAPALRAAEPLAVPESLDLPTAIRFALDNSFAIRQARERIRQQEGVVLEVSADRKSTRLNSSH